MFDSKPWLGRRASDDGGHTCGAIGPALDVHDTRDGGELGQKSYEKGVRTPQVRNEKDPHDR